jgi:hypothetical protein
MRIDFYLMILLFTGTTKMTKKYMGKPWRWRRPVGVSKPSWRPNLYEAVDVTSNYRSNPH